jgi:hypothetical protein
MIPAIYLPNEKKTVQGESLTNLVCDNGEERLFVLVTFIHGIPLSSRGLSTRLNLVQRGVCRGHNNGTTTTANDED